MKKLLLIALVVMAGAFGLMFVKNRFGGMNQVVDMVESTGDLMIMNDSSDAVSLEYKKDGKDAEAVIQTGQVASGGKGFLRIFTAKKAGAYELTYEFPRPEDAKQQVTISEIIGAAKQDKMEGEVYTRRGMIGDIKVFYEEVEQE